MSKQYVVKIKRVTTEILTVLISADSAPEALEAARQRAADGVMHDFHLNPYVSVAFPVVYVRRLRSESDGKAT